MRRALPPPLALAAAPAAARGSAVCAGEQAIPCPRFEACARNLPAAINLPALLRLDPAAKLIDSRMNDGAVRTSPIAAGEPPRPCRRAEPSEARRPWTT